MKYKCTRKHEIRKIRESQERRLSHSFVCGTHMVSGAQNSGTKCTDEEGGGRRRKKCGGYAQAKDDSKKYNVREMRRTRTMEAAMMLSIEKDDEHVPTNAPVSPVANQKQK